MKRLILFIAFFFTTNESVDSAIVLFDFAIGGTDQAGSDLDGLASGSTANGGITLTANANTGVFNRTASSPNFGINASGGGDDTDAFDAGAGTAETMTFSFVPSSASTIEFVSIDFDRITGSGQSGDDQGNLFFDGGSSFDFDATNVDLSDLLLINESIASGQTIVLSHTDGNGFGLERITLELNPIVSSSIPEPISAAVWLGLSICGIGLYAWRTRRTC